MSEQDNTYENILRAMQLRYRELAGFDADDASDIGIRLKVLAEQVFMLYNHSLDLKKQVFAQTSTGAYLDMHAQTRGLNRKAAVPSNGMLRFTREIPAASDIRIDAGVICATRPNPQVRFITVAEGVLRAGETQVDIPACAVDGGKAGNVASGSICLMVTPATGISGVSNPAPFSGGVDEEDDPALRERLLESYKYISNSTNRAFYYDIAMGYKGVASANVIPRRRGRGTVDVVIFAAPDADTAGIISGLQLELSGKKEVNVDVLVSVASRKSQDVTAEIALEDGNAFDAVAEACKKALTMYMDSLDVGEKLLLARLGAVLLSVDGVYNYRVTGISGDVSASQDQIIRPGNIAINRMA